MVAVVDEDADADFVFFLSFFPFLSLFPFSFLSCLCLLLGIVLIIIADKLSQKNSPLFLNHQKLKMEDELFNILEPIQMDCTQWDQKSWNNVVDLLKKKIPIIITNVDITEPNWNDMLSNEEYINKINSKTNEINLKVKVIISYN